MPNIRISPILLVPQRSWLIIQMSDHLPNPFRSTTGKIRAWGDVSSQGTLHEPPSDSIQTSFKLQDSFPVIVVHGCTCVWFLRISRLHNLLHREWPKQRNCSDWDVSNIEDNNNSHHPVRKCLSLFLCLPNVPASQRLEKLVGIGLKMYILTLAIPVQPFAADPSSPQAPWPLCVLSPTDEAPATRICVRGDSKWSRGHRGSQRDLNGRLGGWRDGPCGRLESSWCDGCVRCKLRCGLAVQWFFLFFSSEVDVLLVCMMVSTAGWLGWV